MYFDINDCFLLYDLGSVECLKGQGGKGKPATAKTGPNDARCVVRALGEFFFFFFVFFDTNLLYIYVLLAKYTMERGGR